MDPAQILSNGGVRMDFGGICVLYFIWNVEAKGSWVGGVGTVRHNVRHFAWLQKADLLGYGFSSVRLDGWRHLDTQNYREVHGGVYKRVQADKTQLVFSACGIGYFGIWWVSLKYLSTCNWSSQIPLEVYVSVLWLHSSWLSACFSVPKNWTCGFWKERLV